MPHTFLFDLEKSPPIPYRGGKLRGASQQNFPILKGNAGSMYSLRLDRGAIREPHWHPSAWEFDYCVAGQARMAVVGPNNRWETFEVGPGEIVFIPQGYFHYIENIGPTELHFLVVFNTSAPEPEDDIGISVSFGAIPNAVLAAVFGVAEKVFQPIPKLHEEVVIVPGEKP
jgi:oxalate decarboxylase